MGNVQLRIHGEESEASLFKISQELMIGLLVRICGAARN